MYILHNLVSEPSRQEYGYSRRSQSVTYLTQRRQTAAHADLDELKQYARDLQGASAAGWYDDLLIEGTAVADKKGDVWKLEKGVETELDDWKQYSNVEASA